jgi:hypothetical protein
MLNDDFYTKGFQIFDGTKYIEYIDTTSIVWEYEGGANNDYHPANNKDLINSCLLSMHYEILNDIVPNAIIEKRRLWEGVNIEATHWHNDYKEGPNCFFLLYFTDMDNSTKGAVYFRNTIEEHKIYPKKGMLVAVNCLNNFEHKAELANCTRIVASFYFNI